MCYVVNEKPINRLSGHAPMFSTNMTIFTSTSNNALDMFCNLLYSSNYSKIYFKITLVRACYAALLLLVYFFSLGLWSGIL